MVASTRSFSAGLSCFVGTYGRIETKGEDKAASEQEMMFATCLCEGKLQLDIPSAGHVGFSHNTEAHCS